MFNLGTGHPGEKNDIIQLPLSHIWSCDQLLASGMQGAVLCEVCSSCPFFFPAGWSAEEIGSPIGNEGARGSKIKTNRARRLS